MSRPPSKEMQALLDHVEPGTHVICFAVPSRIIRLIAVGDDYVRACTFRVEQLVPGLTLNTGDWKPLSTHASQIPWESYMPALEAMAKAQYDLVQRLKATAMARQKAASAALGKPGMLPGLGGPPLQGKPYGDYRGVKVT